MLFILLLVFTIDYNFYPLFLQLYRKARLRFVLVGVEEWNVQDKIPKATNSRSLHANFKKYCQGLRKRQNNNFDIAVYFL